MKYSIYIYLAHQDSLPRGCKHQMTAYVALVPADRVIAGDNVNAEQAAAQNMGAYSKFFCPRWGRKDKDVFFGEIRNFEHID